MIQLSKRKISFTTINFSKKWNPKHSMKHQKNLTISMKLWNMDRGAYKNFVDVMLLIFYSLWAYKWQNFNRSYFYIDTTRFFTIFHMSFHTSLLFELPEQNISKNTDDLMKIQRPYNIKRETSNKSHIQIPIPFKTSYCWQYNINEYSIILYFAISISCFVSILLNWKNAT